jgi:hypothetical protein
MHQSLLTDLIETILRALPNSNCNGAQIHVLVLGDQLRVDALLRISPRLPLRVAIADGLARKRPGDGVHGPSSRIHNGLQRNAYGRVSANALSMVTVLLLQRQRHAPTRFPSQSID